MGTESKNVILTGNAVLDKRIADGLPLQSLTLVDGDNDTGKGVLTRQIRYGAMRQEISVDLFTAENTTRSFVRQMESMSLDMSQYFAWGYLRVFPDDIVVFKRNEEEIKGILGCLIAGIGHSTAQGVII